LYCQHSSNSADCRTAAGATAARARGAGRRTITLDVLAPALAACLARGRSRSAGSVRGRSAGSSGVGGNCHSLDPVEEVLRRGPSA
jgi:hypothetical protein